MLHLAASWLLAAMLGGAGAARAGEDAMVIEHIPLPGTGPDVTPPLPMAGRTAVWAHRAGLALRWEAVPFKRSLQDLLRNQRPLCVLGVFDTPERRRFARYSLPIYREEQQVFIVAARAVETLRALPDARAVLLSSQLKLLIYDGVAYGGMLDDWIAERRAPVVRAAAGTANLATMLARAHADFAISVPSELREMQERRVPDAAALQTVLMPGMPPPPQRHLACSLKVPPAWLARFDAAVRADPPP